jgi:RpiB/LacA/LacB family sugar-phosphate isomerase
MRIALSADALTPLVGAVRRDLEQRGHQVEYLGPAAGETADWPDVTRAASERVASGAADEAVVMCWTGTGASLAANKVARVRAALCADAETARGARTWNHANVLALSLRSTSEPIAREILDAWFSTPYSQDEWNRRQVDKIRDMDERKTG